MYGWIFPIISHRNSSLSSCCCDTKTTNNPLPDPPCQTQVTAFREQKTQAIHTSDIITMWFCLHWFPARSYCSFHTVFPSSSSFPHQPHWHLRHLIGAVNLTEQERKGVWVQIKGRVSVTTTMEIKLKGPFGESVEVSLGCLHKAPRKPFPGTSVNTLIKCY